MTTPNRSPEQLRRIEERLAAQLKKDQAKPSHHLGVTEDGTIITKPSGTAVGLAIAIESQTGEDIDAILNRLGNPTMTTEEERQRDVQQTNDLFEHLNEAKREREAREEIVQRLVHSLRPSLEAEIRATGLAVRDAINSMADSFDSAMVAIEKAANTWEDKAVSS